MKKIFYLSLPALALAALPAKAVCPVCVVAVGAGLSLSEYLGIDDSIAGVWIGGLLVSVSAWTITWFNKKNWNFGSRLWRNVLTFVLYYALTFWPLAVQGLVGNPANTLWGLDKIILGTVAGTLGFAAASLWYNHLKKRNGGHAYFPFQKVVMPFAALLILSLAFYYTTK